MRILIVDDRVENNYLLESLLKSKGYSSTSASNGAEALEMLKHDDFNLIISDILMPVMDGFQLCRKVKTDPKFLMIPLIFYTATYTGPKDEEFALKIGAERFVVKPCEPQKFLRIIEEVIAENKKSKPSPSFTEEQLPEEEILKLYSERLVRKLEKKMEQYEEELKARLVAEKTIRANEENLRITLDSIGDAVIATDLQGKITRMNPVAEKLTGWNFTNAEQQPLDKIFTIRNAKTDIIVENPVDIVLKTGAIVTLSNHTKLISQSGQEYHIADSAAPINDKNGKINGVVLVFRDVTETYKMREELQASESLLNATGKIAKVGGWELDAQTRKVSWTEETYRLHEVPRDYEPPLQKAIDFFHPEDREKLSTAIKHSLEKGEAYDLELRFITAKGNQLWARTICQPQIENGKVIKLKGIFQDITERKLAEETMRESEMHYRAIVEAFDGLIYICSQDYRVEFMNERFIKRTGYDGTGELCFKVLHNLETVCPWCVNEKVFKGETVRWEVLSPKDNRWFYVVNSPIYHTDGSMSKQSMILDITERKLAEAEMKSNLSLLQIAGETACFGGWSVDLRNNICTWSDAVADIHEMPHGFAPKLEEGINFYAPEWRGRITQVFSDCAEKGIPYDEEMEIITNTGKRVWVRTIGRAVKDKKGEIIRVEGSFQDISDSKQKQKALQKSEDRLSKIMIAANDGMWDWDLTTNEVYYDPRYYTMAGYNINEFPHSLKEFQKRVHPDDIDNVMSNAEMHFKDKINRFHVEFRFKKKNGDWMWIAGKGIIVERDELGKPLRFVGTHQDITERKKSMTALKQIEWMLSGKKAKDDNFTPEYGDLSELNKNGLILSLVGKDQLTQIASEYLDLLETSSAIYEINGDYALGLFSSGWCRMLDTASRKLCKTDNNHEALTCGKWLCHESCWHDTSLQAIESGKPADVECNGGLHIYAVPISAGGKVIGAINFGYGDPPEADTELQSLSKLYQIPIEELRKKGQEYQTRPKYIIDYAKKRIQFSAQYIANIVERNLAEAELRELKDDLEIQVVEKTKELNERIAELERFHDATIEREFRIKELSDEIEKLKREVRDE